MICNTKPRRNNIDNDALSHTNSLYFYLYLFLRFSSSSSISLIISLLPYHSLSFFLSLLLCFFPSLLSFFLSLLLSFSPSLLITLSPFSTSPLLFLNRILRTLSLSIPTCHPYPSLNSSSL